MLQKGLSVNDSFSTKEEAEKAMVSCATANGLNYDMEETPKSISVSCKGRVEFGCEAKISAMLRKKDDMFVIKKIKLVHKCPSLTMQYGSPDEMVRGEIQKAIGDADVRVGEVVPILADMNIRVGYFSVWKAMRRRIDAKENVGEEENGSKRRRVEDGGEEGLFEAAVSELAREFLDLNPGAVAHHRGQMFFFSFPEYLKVLIPIVEIKVYKKNEGLVVFGVLHDPTSSPIVYSCVVAEKGDKAVIMEYFVDSTAEVFFLVDFDAETIRILKEKGREFFVKTRDICKFYYNKTKSTEVVESVWNKCNNDKECSTPELESLEVRQYIKKHCRVEMMGLQNTSECDVEFINLAVFNFSFFDCVNGILKLIGDNLKQRKKMNINDKKSLFGYNVVHRIEKNISAMPREMTQIVDVGEQTCSCGRFQELLIPCPHACKVIIDGGEDPYLYVGGMYSKMRLLELRDVVPVVNLPVKCQSDRHLLKRGPGRPKKIFPREPEIIIH